MKAVLVIGDLNDKLIRVLNKCVEDNIIHHYVNYEIYNKVHKKVNKEMHLENAALSNEDFCNMFINTTKYDELVNEWVILKGNIHTKDFLHILIKLEKSFDPLYNRNIFLSHIAKLTNKDGKSFYLSDGALNTKQIEDRNVLGNVIKNAQNHIISKNQEISKIDPVISTAIILAANNSNIPGYDVARTNVFDVPDTKHIEIKQFDECFDLASYLIKNPEADAESFTYPDLVITPDITVGNCIWKSLTILNNWNVLGYVIGGRLKTVLLSRSDYEESYYESIKGACND